MPAQSAKRRCVIAPRIGLLPRGTIRSATVSDPDDRIVTSIAAPTVRTGLRSKVRHPRRGQGVKRETDAPAGNQVARCTLIVLCPKRPSRTTCSRPECANSKPRGHRSLTSLSVGSRPLLTAPRASMTGGLQSIIGPGRDGNQTLGQRLGYLWGRQLAESARLGRTRRSGRGLGRIIRQSAIELRPKGVEASALAVRSSRLNRSHSRLPVCPPRSFGAK